MVGDRILLARKKAGLSLRGLAERMDNMVSAQAIGKYERGEMVPRSDVLISISRAVNEPVSFFLSPGEVNLHGLEFRKKAAPRKKDLAAVEAAVLDRIERYLQVEEILELDSSDWDRPDNAPYRIRKIEDAERASIQLRKFWNIGSDPIPNLTELLEERGIKIIMIDFPMSVDAVTCTIKRENRESVHVVACNQHRSSERQRFNLAHELAHQLLGFGKDVDKEKACHRFAGAFLAPADRLLKEVGQRRHSFGYAELIEIKHMYGISAAALIYRLKDLNVISESTLRRLYSGIARTWRRVEPEPIDPEKYGEMPKRFPRLCYRALAEGFVSMSKTSELLRLPPQHIAEQVWGKGTVGEGPR